MERAEQNNYQKGRKKVGTSFVIAILY